MSVSYEEDVIAWADEQAALLHAGHLSAIDIEHIAEEIEDVGKSEKRELASRMSVLLTHLLKWRFQPGRRGTGTSWKRALKEQRKAIALCLKATPSLRTSLTNPDWLEGVWADAVAQVVDKTGLASSPETCPWQQDKILSPDFYPD